MNFDTTQLCTNTSNIYSHSCTTHRNIKIHEYFNSPRNVLPSRKRVVPLVFYLYVIQYILWHFCIYQLLLINTSCISLICRYHISNQPNHILQSRHFRIHCTAITPEVQRVWVRFVHSYVGLQLLHKFGYHATRRIQQVAHSTLNTLPAPLVNSTTED